jgi:pyruvate dehydrogenase E1 component alpha subunit
MAKAAKAPKELSETPEKLIDLYRQMVFIRFFEKKCNFAYRQGKIGGYMHTYIGMEATGVGFNEALRPGWDNVITAYRDHAQPLLMGSDPLKVMAETMGRVDGYSNGKGGSMHIYDFENRFFGGWGIVGGHIPIGTGVAFTAKYKKEDRVTVCYLGDGAANQGVVFESYNMAALWDLPIIYAIENNEFAMGTRLEYHASDTELYKRGIPFGIKSERIDGMDVLQVKEDAARIVEWVRENQKPYLVEIMNYRYEGHGAADNDRQLYRTKEEEEEAMLRDPIGRLARQMVDAGAATEADLEKIDDEEEERVEVIFEQADASPHPDPSEVYDHVYTDMTPEMGH